MFLHSIPWVLHGSSKVSANIRMLVVRLQDGKLWVCGPIAPTQECLNLLDELGEVGHLVVPGTALEHKSSLADFARSCSCNLWLGQSCRWLAGVRGVRWVSRHGQDKSRFWSPLYGEYIVWMLARFWKLHFIFILYFSRNHPRIGWRNPL